MRNGKTITLPRINPGPMTPLERATGRYMRAFGGHSSGMETKAGGFPDLERKSASEIGSELKAWFTNNFANNDEVKGVIARVEELEQRGDRPRGSAFGSFHESYGTQVARSAGIKQLQDERFRPNSAVRIELKAITTAANSGGGLIYRDRDMEIAGMPQRTVRIRDLVTVLRTGSSSVDYAKQVLRTNNAAAVPEGQLKPYSEYGWQKVNAPVRTIAHLSKITRQAAEDSAQLADEVDTEMRYGLQLAEDLQLLNGDGTGENLLGLLVQATAFAVPAGMTIANPTRLDRIGQAIAQLLLLEFVPDGIIMNPIDFWMIKLLKDAGGGYIALNPIDGKMGDDDTPRLFGLPVAVTTAMAVGSFSVGAFKRQKLYDRLAPEVLISSENADDFEKNLLTMRCEERIAFAVRYAAAIIKGTFG